MQNGQKWAENGINQVKFEYVLLNCILLHTLFDLWEIGAKVKNKFLGKLGTDRAASSKL